MKIKTFLKTLQLLRQTAKSTLIVGLILFLNHQEIGKTFISSGGFSLAIYFFFSGFLPLNNDIEWNLVNPEASFSDDELSDRK